MDDIPEPRILDGVRAKIRVKHYGIRTEHAYVDGIKRFVLHHGKRHPAELGAGHAEAFPSCLALDGRVASSTQSQAKCALLLVYREVLGVNLSWFEHVDPIRAGAQVSGRGDGVGMAVRVSCGSLLA